MDSPEVLKAFALAACVGEGVSPSLRDIAGTAGLEESDREFIGAIGQLDRPVRQLPDPLDEAASALRMGDFDTAFALAAPTVPGLRRTRILLRCAGEMLSEESVLAAANAIESASADQRASVLAQADLRELWESLRPLLPGREQGVTGGLVPHDWTTWLSELDAGRLIDNATLLAERGAREWQLEEELGDEAKITQLATSLLRSDRKPDVAERLRQNLPFLSDFFAPPGEIARRAVHPVLDAIAALIILDPLAGDVELRALTGLVEARILGGIDILEYRQMIDDLVQMWREHGAPRRIDLALDLMDVLLDLPCPDTDARLKLGYEVHSTLRQSLNRISRSQAELFFSLGDETGADFRRGLPNLQAVAGARAEEDQLAQLGRRRIALYSLVETALQRAQRVLAVCAPEATVSLHHDHVGSVALREASLRADVFVVVTQAAKHAATEFIEANRPQGTPILRPPGKGTASLLRSLREYASSLPYSRAYS